MTILKSNFTKITALSLCVLMVILLCFQFSAHSDEIDETNPELTLEKIDSTVENDFYSKGVYMQTTDFQQGGGKYNITTNSYVAWSYNDDIAFAYKKYNVSENSGDFMEASVILDEVPYGKPGQMHHNASAGLMFRSGLESDDAEVFLHVRGTEILAVYRSKKGNGTAVQRKNMTVKYPVEIKMVKRANQVNLSYKSAGADWLPFAYPIGLTAKGPLYVGLAAHSCDEVNSIVSNFSNLKIKGVGTWDGTGGNEDTSSVVSEYVEEDSPIGSNVLMRETFTDGDLTNKPASPSNPIWPQPEELSIVNLDGNRVWDRTFIDQQDWVGDVWTDYKVSVDVQFTEKCNPDPEAASNTFRLSARHTGIEFYGHSDYTATVTNGYKVGLYKRTFLKDDPSANGYLLASVDLSEWFGKKDEDNNTIPGSYSCLGDGKFHKLELTVFDNKLTVTWDGIEIIHFTDTGVADKSTGKRVFPMGNVGISTFETSVYVDNLTVEKMEDTFGGDYDNKIGGNWDLPTPDYITSWQATGY